MKQSYQVLAILSLLCGSLAAEASTKIDVFVDSETEPRQGENIRIPAGTSTLRFRVKPKSPRVRYLLKGLDETWDERSDPNYLWVRFISRRGDIVGIFPFPVAGSSPGWRGSLEKSVFTPREAELTVPPGVASIALIMSTAGPAALVGTFAIRDMEIVLEPRSGKPSITIMEDSRLAANGNVTWTKSGSHPSMSAVTNLDENGGGSPVLVITDDDVNAHADLATQIRSPEGLRPGDTIRIRWKEAYNTGVGGNFVATYDRLPPGEYTLLVEDLSLIGAPLGSGAEVEITVPAVFWKTFWFWATAAAIVAAVFFVVGRLLIRHRIHLHLLQEQMISDERRRIALDLHDDIGTRISHISLVASHADNTIPHEGAKKAFGQISSMSRDLIGALSETVWMLNPKNDDLESLVDFLYRLAKELCRLKRIRCRVDAVFITENEPVPYDFRHNVSLAVKESINNVLKHSEATEFNMKIEFEQRVLSIAITDNGIGMTDESRSDGLGLDNLTRRMKTIGGSCEIEQLDEGGMRIVLNAPLSRKSKKKPTT